MSFSINFYDEPAAYPYDDDSTEGLYGRLQLGAFEEDFLSSLFQWTTLDYEKQWREAIQAILDGADRAALMVEYISPEFASKLEWWPMYRVGDTVYLQNHFLFYDQLDRPFLIEQMFTFVKDPCTVTEEGKPISEWSVSLADLMAFAHIPSE